MLKYPHHGLNKMNRELFAMIDPELAIITNKRPASEESLEFLKKKHVSAYITRKNMLRLRTDGQIWVLDNLIDQAAP